MSFIRFRKFLQRFGIYFHYFPTAGHLYRCNKDLPFSAQEAFLKRISNVEGIPQKEDFYNELLSLYVPDWDLKIKNSEFIGKGEGWSNLKNYRKIETADDLLFEKVYFSSENELKTVLWVDENLKQILNKKGIKIPEIRKVYSGPVLTIVYFEFIELKKSDSNVSEKRLIDLNHKMIKLSAENEIKELIRQAPENLKDYQNHFQFKANLNAFKELLNKEKLPWQALISSINESNKIITHGDLQTSNIYDNNILIDWDAFGIYPPGLEEALLFSRLKSLQQSQVDLRNWLGENYKSALKEEEFKELEFGFMFFILAFYSHKKEENIRSQAITYLKTHR